MPFNPETDIKGEEFVKVQNDKTGEIQIVGKEDLKQISVKESPKEEKPTLTEKTKAAADKFRKLKGKPLTIKRADGTEITITKSSFLDDAIEIGAQAIELSGKIADGIKAAIDHIKEQKWYKDLTKEDQEVVNEQIGEYFGSVEQKKSKTKMQPPKASSDEIVTETKAGKEKELSVVQRIRKSSRIKDKPEIEALLRSRKARYKVSNMNKARNYAKQIVDEFGIDEAVNQARQEKYGGSVSSAIMAESIDRLWESNNAAQYGDLLYEYAIDANEKGKYNAQIYDFYRKSPAGIMRYAENMLRERKEELLAKHDKDIL